MPPPARPCAHCARSVHFTTRGLCYSCYRTPAVRSLYPLLFQRKLPPLPSLPPADPGPTSFPAHSEPQLAVFAARAALGLPLFDPRDTYETCVEYIHAEHLPTERPQEIPHHLC